MGLYSYDFMHLICLLSLSVIVVDAKIVIVKFTLIVTGVNGPLFI